MGVFCRQYGIKKSIRPLNADRSVIAAFSSIKTAIALSIIFLPQLPQLPPLPQLAVT